MILSLTPTQQRALELLTEVLPLGYTFRLWTPDGLGRSTMLRELHRRLGGALVTLGELIPALRGQSPLAIEETFHRIILEALEAHPVVLVDDLHLMLSVVANSCGSGSYPRNELIELSMISLLAYAEARERKLIFATSGRATDAVTSRCYSWGFPEFDVDDYAALGAAYLTPEQAAGLEYAKIHRFARHLNGHQLRNACVYFRQKETVTTEAFIEYLRSQGLTSNVALQEVQKVELRDLKGIDDIIQSLEANIVLPLENDALAERFDLQPKRGVLLAGPPGTGKTTVGRALAHRLKSKFFLIDGTFISGTGRFYAEVHQIFEAAKENAPSVIFIDDSDVIFESGEESGLYRYLLTMLDGLESESAGQVCVMLTAMDVGNLPPALLRSGRVELWLETRLPEPHAREAILRDHFSGIAEELADVDLSRLVAETEGFTGADLKRVVSDGKLLFAHDLSKTRELKPATAYFTDAIQGVKENKERYARAERNARRKRPERPPWFTPGGEEEDDS